MSDYKRQHPLMIVGAFIGQLKSLLLPAAVLFAIQLQGDGGTILPMVLVASAFLGLSFVFSLVKWWFYRYKYEHSVLIIRSGIFIKHHRTIKQERVQTTNTHAGLFLRLFGLVKLTIETAGSKGEAEFELEALREEEARAIMARLSGEDHSHTSEAQQSTSPLTQLTFRTLMLAGLTSGGVGVIFSILAVIWSQIFSIVPQLGERLVDSVIGMSIVIIVFMLVVLILLSWVISTVRFMIRYAFFTIERVDDELRIEHGLIARKRFTVKIHRIQALSVVEGILRQPFDLATIELTTAGASGYDDAFKVIALPIVRKDKIHTFLSEFLPEYAVSFTLDGLVKRAQRRYIFRASAIFLAVLPLWFITPHLYWLFALWPVSLILGIMRHKDGGLYTDATTLVYRFRFLARTTAIVHKKHIQSMEFHQNPLQRLRRFAHTSVSVMAAPSSVQFSLKDIDMKQYETLYTWFSYKYTLQ